MIELTWLDVDNWKEEKEAYPEPEICNFLIILQPGQANKKHEPSGAPRQVQNAFMCSLRMIT